MYHFPFLIQILTHLETIMLTRNLWKSRYAVYRCPLMTELYMNKNNVKGKSKLLYEKIRHPVRGKIPSVSNGNRFTMWNRKRTTSIFLELIIVQWWDASSSILVSLRCNAPSPAPIVGIVSTSETIVITNHVARYAKHWATNLEIQNIGSMSNYKTLLRLMGKIMFYRNFSRVI